MYKIVVGITKETWGKCGIKTVNHYNEKEDIIELWQKVSNVKTQIKHSNICDIVLKELESTAAKKTKQNKRHYRTRKTKIQSIFLK